MPSMKSILVTAAICMVVIAVVFKVQPLRSALTT